MIADLVLEMSLDLETQFSVSVLDLRFSVLALKLHIAYNNTSNFTA